MFDQVLVVGRGDGCVAKRSASGCNSVVGKKAVEVFEHSDFRNAICSTVV